MSLVESDGNNDGNSNIAINTDAALLLSEAKQAADNDTEVTILNDHTGQITDSTAEPLWNDPASDPATYENETTYENGNSITGTLRNESYAYGIDNSPTGIQEETLWRNQRTHSTCGVLVVLWKRLPSWLTKILVGIGIAVLVVLVVGACLLLGFLGGYLFGSKHSYPLNPNSTDPPTEPTTDPPTEPTTDPPTEPTTDLPKGLITLVGCGNLNGIWMLFVNGKYITVGRNGKIEESNYRKQCNASMTHFGDLQVNCIGLFICDRPPESPCYYNTSQTDEVQDGKMTCKTKDKD